MTLTVTEHTKTNKRLIPLGSFHALMNQSHLYQTLRQFFLLPHFATPNAALLASNGQDFWLSHLRKVSSFPIFKCISVDFLRDLPTSNGASDIFVRASECKYSSVTSSNDPKCARATANDGSVSLT